jgi:hypothetical protein
LACTSPSEMLYDQQRQQHFRPAWTRWRMPFHRHAGFRQCHPMSVTGCLLPIGRSFRGEVGEYPLALLLGREVPFRERDFL